MKQRPFLPLLLGGIALWCAVASAQGGGQGGFDAYPQRPVTDPAAVERGKALFSVNCGFCHGADARGGDSGGPNLMRSDVVLLDDKGERIGEVVKPGRPDRGMPSFKLTDAQIADVAAFLHSLPVSSRTGNREIDIVTGNAETGRTLFQTKCSSCHSPTGDLHGVASRYSDPKTLQQTWLLPGTGGRGREKIPTRPAPPIGVTVTTPGGQTIAGTLNRIDDFMVSLRLADGTYRTFRTEGQNSPKVELRDPLQGHRDLLHTYSDADIHNVTAYLVTLK